LADACGACGCPSEAVDLLVHLGDEGLLPDNLMLTAVARAFSGGHGKEKEREKDGVKTLNAAEVWTTQDWGKLQRKSGEQSLYLRKRAKGGTITYSPPVNGTSGNNSNHSSSGALHSLVSASSNVSADSMVGSQSSSSEGLDDLKNNSGAKGNGKNGSGGGSGSGSGSGGGIGSVGTPQKTNGRKVSNGAESGSSFNGGADVHGTASATSPSTISPNSHSPSRSPRPPNVSLSSALTMSLFPEYISSIPSFSGTLPVSSQNGRSPARTGRGMESMSGRTTASSSSSSSGSGSSSSGNGVHRDQWTSKAADGLVPELQWRDLSSPTRRPVFAISRVLNRHMLAAERLLDSTFPGLAIDLRNPMGSSCPSVKCRKVDREVLSIGELYRGFTSPSSIQMQAAYGPSFSGTGDPNKYTTRCPHCGYQFVPRFTVKCDAKGWMGASSVGCAAEKGTAGQVLWCELLSPWTLRKEMFNVLFQDGVSSLLSEEFHRSSVQHAVVFWNAIITFRLRGLPYAFMFCNDVVTRAFPPREPSTSITRDREGHKAHHKIEKERIK
jgi:hypothetical protein